MHDLKFLASVEKSWKFRTLKNGIRVVHLPVVSDHRLYFSCVFQAGARYEKPAKAGISHFLEHMMFRGSKNYPTFLALADAFEWLGGHWNAETGLEHTEYMYSGVFSTLPDVVRLFAEFLGHPKLLDIEVEREVILREIEDELNEFNLSTDIDWQTSNLIWPKFGLGNPIAGTLESVRDLTNEDLIAYRNENYSADRLAIFIAGGQDSETIFSLVDAHFASYPIKGTGQIVNRGAPEPFKGPKFRFVENMDNQYHISLGFVVGGEWSNDEPGYELISRILSDSFSSRLSLRIREQLGLVYDISCDEALLSDFGVMTIQTQITPDKLGVVLKEICEILRTFREGGPTDDEMRKALLRAEVRMSLAAYEPEQLGFRVAWNSLHDRSYSLSARLEKIRSQNGDGLRKLAEKLFCKRNCAVVVIGPKDSELQAEAEGIVRKHLS